MTDTKHIIVATNGQRTCYNKQWQLTVCNLIYYSTVPVVKIYASFSHYQTLDCIASRVKHTELTIRRESQLLAQHSCLSVVPEWVTDCNKYSIYTELKLSNSTSYTSDEGSCKSTGTNLTIRARSCTFVVCMCVFRNHFKLHEYFSREFI